MALIHFDKKEATNELWKELFLMDNYLSFKAKGMMAFLYDIDGDVVIELDKIKDFTSDGIGTIKSALKELEHLGYITREMIRDEHGKFLTVQYTVHYSNRERTIGGDCYC